MDTSVVIALANPDDSFHSESLRFADGLQRLGVDSAVGPPILLELGKAIQQRSVESALRVRQTLDKFAIELADVDSNRLLSLVNSYVVHRVAGIRHRLDLLHYASATLLSCSHLASWDKAHFNQQVQRRINRINSISSLTPSKVGDPMRIGRSLGLG
jgi:predicted nucleic acid-binding protein